jgi:hypothetical protein
MSDLRRCTETSKAEFAAQASTAALDLIEQVKPLFYGKHPAIQGAALAELTSLWLAGHERQLRDELLALHNDTIIALTKVNAKKLRGE